MTMYRYFVSYTWQDHKNATGVGNMGVGNTWVDRPALIEGPEDLAEAVTALKGAVPALARTEIIVLNFQQVTAPATPAAAWTGRTDREAAALAEVENLVHQWDSGLPVRGADFVPAGLRRLRKILDGGR